MVVLVALGAAVGAVFAQSAPQGVPRELARSRAAAISELRYRLHFTLVPHADTTTGHEEISFRLKSAAPLLLDFREGTVSKLTVNGQPISTAIENGHLVLPEGKLRAGENAVVADFAAPVAPAGKAITRFQDRDDNTEYLYALLVPMDASMAFPCFDQPDLKGRFRLEITAPEAWTALRFGPLEDRSFETRN